MLRVTVTDVAQLIRMSRDAMRQGRKKHKRLAIIFVLLQPYYTKHASGMNLPFGSVVKQPREFVAA